MSEEQKTEESAAFDAEALNKLEAEFSEGLAADEKAAAGVIADDELRPLVAGVLGMGFAVLAPNWEVIPEEVEQLTNAYTALLDKYCPEGLGDYGVEIAAVMVTAAVFAPRIGTPRKPEEKPEARPEARPEQFPSVISDEG